jgi:hypothetical protein
MKHTLTMTVAALAFAAPMAGQEQRVMVTRPGQPQAALEKQIVEVARAAVESRITPGAPYSADAVTESVHVLSDGNRIARKTATRIYRDSEGRTRREQLTTTGEVQSINISDPIAGSMYVLNPATRTAYRNGVVMSDGRGGGATAGVASGSGGGGTVIAMRTPEAGSSVAVPADEMARRREVETQAVAAAAAGGGGVAVAGRGRSGERAVGPVPLPGESPTLERTMSPARGSVAKEELGQQVVEGVLATGTRTTTTLPAGTIGNEQPIVVLSEQWFSEELKVLVMTKHSDPRTGITTYRLTNVVQAEPARSLFEVPADYTLKDSVIRRQSPMQN